MKINFVFGHLSAPVFTRKPKKAPLSERYGGPVYLVASMVISLIILLICLGGDHGFLDFQSGVDEIETEDFAAFYRGGQLALQGEAARAYEPQYFSLPFTESNQKLLFLNPPHAFLFFEPLAQVSYPVARAIGILTNLAAVLGLVYITRLSLGISPYLFSVCSVGAYLSFFVLQISPIFCFLLLFALINSERHPMLSGVALALATIKPQYGVLFPVYLIAIGNWRAFLFASIGTVGVVALSIAVYGLEIWQVFLDSLEGGGHFEQYWGAYEPMITISHSLGKLGASDLIRMIGQISVLGLCTALIWFAARRLPREDALPIVWFAFCITAPSFFLYDWIFLSAGLLLFLRCCPNWSLSLQMAASLLMISPVIQAYLIVFGGEYVMSFSAYQPLLIAGVCALMVRELVRQKSASRSIPKTMVPEPVPVS